MINKEKVIRHFMINLKKLISLFKTKKSPKAIVYILGYGRSGTSILINLFAHLFNVDAHGEASNLVMKNFQLDNSKMNRLIDYNRFDVIALKPILNSCDAKEILNETHNRSRIIWLYRDYKDVVCSALKMFGIRVSIELREVVIEGKKDGWISNQIHKQELEILRSLDVLLLTNTDWMALVWWFVNHTIIRESLFDDDNFIIIEYNDLVKNPKLYIDYVNRFCSFKENHLYKYIDSSKIGKGNAIILSKSVENMCDELYIKLMSSKIKL